MVDSRQSEDGASIRRRRSCLACDRRFTTFERFEEVALTVLKRSGDRQPFGRDKVIAGVRAAIKGRPVQDHHLVELADEVEESMRLSGSSVTSEAVGRAVLERLRDLDVVAAVRFASVYKEFDDLADFEREVSEVTRSSLTKASAPKGSRPAP